MDLDQERSLLLYRDADGPPSNAWDVQVPVPPAVAAWLLPRRTEGQPSGLYIVGAHRARVALGDALPAVPTRSHSHQSPDVIYPHVHVLVGMCDGDGQPVQQERVERAAVDAWIAQADRIVEYTSERPHLGIRWTPDGSIVGVDHSRLAAFTCHGFYGGDQPVIVGHP